MTSRTIEEAAAKAGIAESTGRRWLQDPDFVKQFRRTRQGNEASRCACQRASAEADGYAYAKSKRAVILMHLESVPQERFWSTLFELSKLKNLTPEFQRSKRRQ